MGRVGQVGRVGLVGRAWEDGTTCGPRDARPMALAHHKLVAWQRADDLCIKLHQLSLKAFPAFERYELGAQLRRAAFSVAANIVEGSATTYWRKRLHFLDTASSSLAEVGYLHPHRGPARIRVRRRGGQTGTGDQAGWCPARRLDSFGS